MLDVSDRSRRGMYFEEFSLGQAFHSPARTIGEADFTMFSMLSGDWNALHSDAVYAASSQFKRRIAHGALGIAIVTGLLTRMGIFEETAVALLNFREWQFQAPVFINDTLHLELVITSARPTKGGDKGILDRHIQLINHLGVVVQEGHSAVLMLSRLNTSPC